MDDSDKTNDPCFSKTVVSEGKSVTVCARHAEDFGWELIIYGKPLQQTTWFEWFATADEAMQAGLNAILEEGVATFYADPEFEYLDVL